jgi:hypothetical protein
VSAVRGVVVALLVVGAATLTYGAHARREAQRERVTQQEAAAAARAGTGDVLEELAATIDDTTPGSPTAERNPDVAVLYSDLPAPERDLDRIRFTLDARGNATYIHELLDTHDGWSFRWPERRGEPMRIWVQEPQHEAYDRAWTTLVREAFSAWGDLGLPLFFTFTADSARAQIIVTWVDRFPERMTGRTRWQHDQHGWIVGSNIQLALHLPDGRRVTHEGVRAIARHEVGHLIGLDHTADTTSIMAAQVFVTELSEADRRTARLVYDLPPGRIRP